MADEKVLAKAAHGMFLSDPAKVVVDGKEYRCERVLEAKEGNHIYLEYEDGSRCPVAMNRVGMIRSGT